MRVLGEYGSDRDVRRRHARLPIVILSPPTRWIRTWREKRCASRRWRMMAACMKNTAAPTWHRSRRTSGRTFCLPIYFRTPGIARRHLDFSISEDVAAGDAILGLNFYSAILDDHTPLYAWLDENLDAFLAKLPSYYSPLVPQVIGGGACSEE